MQKLVAARNPDECDWRSYREAVFDEATALRAAIVRLARETSRERSTS